MTTTEGERAALQVDRTLPEVERAALQSDAGRQLTRSWGRGAEVVVPDPGERIEHPIHAAQESGGAVVRARLQLHLTEQRHRCVVGRRAVFLDHPRQCADRAAEALPQLVERVQPRRVRERRYRRLAVGRVRSLHGTPERVQPVECEHGTRVLREQRRYALSERILFDSDRGELAHVEPVPQSQVHRRLKGFPDLVPYDLRHIFISTLIAEGRDVYWIARQAGHSPTMTLNTYGHLFEAGYGREVGAPEVRRQDVQLLKR